eukprot:975159-Pyramimonas_sp.AAC.1
MSRGRERSRRGRMMTRTRRRTRTFLGVVVERRVAFVASAAQSVDLCPHLARLRLGRADGMVRNHIRAEEFLLVAR